MFWWANSLSVSACAQVQIVGLMSFIALQMGLNMIRLWGGAGATCKAFYDACDEAGILVWQEFCITGDCNGRGSTPVRSSFTLLMLSYSNAHLVVTVRWALRSIHVVQGPSP